MREKLPVPNITKLALLTSVSLILYLVESLIPPLVPIPGIKLGLANIITLIVLSRFSFREAALVLLCRILLSGFFFGQALSLLYSLAGGFCCLLAMTLIHLVLTDRYLTVTSIFGAIAHNLAQLLVAFVVTRVPGVVAYLPFLMLSAILTGLFTGLCATFTLRLFPRQLR